MIKRFLQSHPIHKKIAPKLDLFFLINPTLFFTIWILPISGMICANINILENSLWNTQFSHKIFFIFLGITFVIGSAFILIQINSNNPIVNKYSVLENFVSLAKGQVIAKILLIIGGLILLISNWVIFFLMICIYFFWGIGINHKLFSWDDNFLLSWIVHSLNGSLLFMIGWFLVVDNLFSFDFSILIIFSYLLFFTSISYMIVVFQFKIDFSKTYLRFLVPLLFAFFCLYMSIQFDDPFLSTTIIISLPFYVFLFFRRLEKDLIRSIRYPIFIFNFFSFSYYPWLIIPILITYYLSKYYYWHRFTIHYPTFLVEND